MTTEFNSRDDICIPNLAQFYLGIGSEWVNKHSTVQYELITIYAGQTLSSYCI